MASLFEKLSAARDHLGLDNLIATVESARGYLNGGTEPTVSLHIPEPSPVRTADTRREDTTATNPPARVTALPQWDNNARTLSFRGIVLKKYSKHPADNQGAVLKEFEKAGWPCAIRSPIRKDQIRDTVRGLNRAVEKVGLIQFHADGTGKGIRWEERK